MSQSQKPLSFEAGSLPETCGLPIRLDWVVCEPQEPTVSDSLVLRLQVCATLPVILCVYRELNLGFYTCTESILLTKLFTQH